MNENIEIKEDKGSKNIPLENMLISVENKNYICFDSNNAIELQELVENNYDLEKCSVICFSMVDKSKIEIIADLTKLYKAIGFEWDIFKNIFE